MLRSSFSKASLGVALLAALNMGAMEVPEPPIVLNPTLPAAQTITQKAGTAFNSFCKNTGSLVKSTKESVQSAFNALPGQFNTAMQAACTYCKTNPKKVGFGAAIVAILGGALYYFHTNGYLKAGYEKAKKIAASPFASTKKAVTK